MDAFEGVEITEEFVDDLVSEWHDFQSGMPTTLREFVLSNTGWSDSQYDVWVVTGAVP